MYGTLNKHSLFLNKLPFPWRRGWKKKKGLRRFSKYNLNVCAHSQCSIFTQMHEDFLSFRSLSRFWRFLLTFGAATQRHMSIWECDFVLCVFVLYLELVAHGTLSPVRMEGDTQREMRQGDGSSKEASWWPGRMGTGKKNPVSGLIVPLMSLQAVTLLCSTLHYPSVRVR